MSRDESPGPGWPLRAAVRYLWRSLLALTCASGFILVTAVAGGRVTELAGRVALGLAVTVALPLLLRRWLFATGAGRGPQPRGGASAWLLVWNGALVALLCLGFCSPVGRSLRRRGDWFLGEADGWLAGRYRVALAAAAAWMERIDLPAGTPAALLESARPRPDVAPPAANEPGRPREPGWIYPLGGPSRVTARWAIQRFGSPRGGWQPPECEAGHCGLDLEQPRGTPVYAVRDGVVLAAVRNEVAGRGRYLRLGHLDGQVVTVYLHLDRIRDDLRVGTRVKGGEEIARVGHTGLNHSGAHLHFELAVHDGKQLRFVDPEPIIRSWALPSARESAPDGPGRCAMLAR